MPDLCERCGRNLDDLGKYKSYMHYRADMEGSVPCMDLPEYLKEPMDAIERDLCERLSATIDEVMRNEGKTVN